MKKLFILFPLLVFVLTVSATHNDDDTPSVYKYRAYSVAFMDVSKGETKFAEATEANILIVLNFDQDRVLIFSKVDQTIDITEYQEWKKDDDGDEFMEIEGIDQDGDKCTLTLMHLISQKGRMQLYVHYPEFNVVYNMRYLK